MIRSTLGSKAFDIAAQRHVAEIFRTISPDEFLAELRGYVPCGRDETAIHALYAGWALNDAGEYLRARRQLLVALRLSRPGTRDRILVHGLLGDSYLRVGQLERAEHCAHRGLGSDLRSDEGGYLEAGHQMMLARIHELRGLVSTSLQIGNACLARMQPDNPMWVPIHCLLVFGHLRLGRLAEAEALVASARPAEDDPSPARRQSWALDEAECWLALALGDHERALRAIGRARSSNFVGSGARVQVLFEALEALVLVARREWRSAERIARHALERCTANSRNSDMGVIAGRALALALMGQERWHEALESARFSARVGLVLDRFEGVAALRYVAECHVALGERDAARRAFREALGVHAGAQFVGERRTLEASIERAGLAELLAREGGSRAAPAGGRVLHRTPLSSGRTFHTSDTRLLEAVRSAALTDLPVLVEGETGTGKNLVARVIHELGPRALRPFVTVDCSTLPASHADAVLFGAVAGTTPGVTADREGLLAQSDGGTLVLDGLPALATELQARLLSVVEEGEYRRLGEDRARRVRIRFVATSVGDVNEFVADRRVLPDLFFRLCGHRISLRPLRTRPAEIPLLADAFARRFGLAGITPAAVARLRSQYWPGNERQLEMTLRLLATSLPTDSWLDLERLEEQLARGGPAEAPAVPNGTLRENRAAGERAALLDALTQNDGIVTRAARSLGLSRQGFYKAMQRTGLAPAGRGRRPARTDE